MGAPRGRVFRFAAPADGETPPTALLIPTTARRKARRLYMTTAPQTAAPDVLAHFHARAAYATDNAHATMLVAEILADAGDGLIALDIETAPIASERARLAAHPDQPCGGQRP